MRFQEYHIQQNEALAAKAGLLGPPRWSKLTPNELFDTYDFLTTNKWIEVESKRPHLHWLQKYWT